LRASAPHAAVLLAAGGSRRLGRAKQLLTRDGEALVHRSARLLRDTAAAALVVVLGADGDAVEATLADLATSGDVRCVRNDAWTAGLSGSLRRAGDALAGFEGRVLVATCDHPALDLAHLQALLALARAAPSGCAATRHEAHAGIPAVVPAAWLRAMPINAGDRGLGDRLRALPREDLPVLDGGGASFDVDTPDDVAIAVARGWLDPPAAS